MKSPEEMDRFERLEHIYRDLGFYPVSKSEQVQVLQLEAVMERPGGAARYLAEVAQRQHKPHIHIDDPTSTGRSLVRSYIDWARDAHMSANASRDVIDELNADIVNPMLRVNRVLDEADGRLIPWVRFKKLQWLYDYREAGVAVFDPQDNKLDYSLNNPDIVHALQEETERATIGELKGTMSRVWEHEQHRRDFFVDRLGEVVKFSPRRLGAIALDGLEHMREAA